MLAGVSSIDLSVIGDYYTYHTEYDNYDYLSKYADPGMLATRYKGEGQATTNIFKDNLPTGI